jgi:FtsP/CotA-like multicopper oxidase with cupredoxin domain
LRCRDHTFKVIALDGNLVPTPAEVPVLWLGTAERISAIVEMNRPGMWVMGDLAERNAAERGFNQWAINDAVFSNGSMTPAYHLRQRRRYRLRMRNASDDIHPIHLHRHSFELTKVAGTPVAGIMKDVVMVGGYQEVEVDLIADNPGLTLFHCHQQLHMDFGFMTLFDYV